MAFDWNLLFERVIAALNVTVMCNSHYRKITHKINSRLIEVCGWGVGEGGMCTRVAEVVTVLHLVTRRRAEPVYC